MKKSFIWYSVFFVIAIIYPHFVNSSWVDIGTTFALYSVVALSQDIVLGKAGMFDMGHATFFGIGAYTAAILNTTYNIPIMYTIPIAIALSALFGIIISWPIIHLRGDYLLVATIGFNIIFYQALQNNVFGLTGGPNGIFGIGTPVIFGINIASQKAIYYFAWFILLITMLIIYNIDKSKLGRTFHYLRESEIAAESFGVNKRFYKVLAFALGAGLASLAGVIFAVQYAAVSPETFNFTQSVLFFTIVIVGGPSSIPGILLGTFVMFVVPQFFREFATARYFVFGIAMILTMILRPQGIWPTKFGKLPKYIFKES
ncbi:MAG: branched-chain amino acid ABC transporter permease [Desulfurella sp.]|jgi:branched-chain amino acid transport system permease protein